MPDNCRKQFNSIPLRVMIFTLRSYPVAFIRQQMPMAECFHIRIGKFGWFGPASFTSGSRMMKMSICMCLRHPAVFNRPSIPGLVVMRTAHLLSANRHCGNLVQLRISLYRRAQEFTKFASQAVKHFCGTLKRRGYRSVSTVD